MENFSYRVALGKNFWVKNFKLIKKFSVVYVYVAELYPTSVRSIGTGLASMTARFGGVAAPYVILLQTTAVWIPLVI